MHTYVHFGLSDIGQFAKGPIYIVATIDTFFRYTGKQRYASKLEQNNNLITDKRRLASCIKSWIFTQEIIYSQYIEIVKACSVSNRKLGNMMQVVTSTASIGYQG